MREHKTQFIQELYESYIDIKNGSLTITRLYVIVFISIIFSLTILAVIMVFFQEYFMASYYLVSLLIFYTIMRYRKVPSLAKYLDIMSFMALTVCTLAALTFNTYLYSRITSGQLYIFPLVGLLFLIKVQKSKKRMFLASFLLAFFIFYFVALVLVDAYIWHPQPKTNDFFDALNICSVFMVIIIQTITTVVIGLKSVGDVEKLSIDRYKSSLAKLQKNSYLSKKEFTLTLHSEQKASYEQLNIALFELNLISKKKDDFLLVDDFFSDKITQEFVGLIKAYYPKDEIFIRWDKNNFVLLAKAKDDEFYFILQSIFKDFSNLIKNEQDRYNAKLRITAHYHEFIDTDSKPKIVLEAINNVIRYRNNYKSISEEFIIYKKWTNDECCK